MALFKRMDPAADAYRRMMRDKAKKKDYDFIGQTGKGDLKFEETDAYKKPHEKAIDELEKPLPRHVKEDKDNDLDADHKRLLGRDEHFWHPSDDDHTMNANDAESVAKKSAWLRREIAGRRTYHPGHIIDEMPLPYAEKHRVAVELMHHDEFVPPTDPKFQETKLPIDHVLEEMTKERPDEEKRARIKAAIDSFKPVGSASYQDNHFHRYLKNKYQFATADHEVGPYKHYEGDDALLSKEEVEKHRGDWKFIHNRTIQKAGDSDINSPKYQLHKDGSISRISSLINRAHRADISADIPFTNEDVRKSIDFHHTNLRDYHGEHIRMDPNLDYGVTKYTEDSGPFNHFHATGEKKSYNSWRDQFETVSESLSKGMKNSPPYGHKITAWTGLSKQTLMGRYSKNKEGHEMMLAHFPAFTSTSLNPKTAYAFAKPKQSADGFENQNIHDVMKVEIPKAYHRGLYVDGKSSNVGEYEYLMDKGHDFEVHPHPMYHANGGELYRVWHARPLLSEEDQDTINHRTKQAKEF